MKRLRIYVAGPVTSHDKNVVNENIINAKKVGEELLKLGHFPYVPHTHFSKWDIDIYEHYSLLQLHGNDILEKWADALFFIASSKGANLEREKAEKLGLRIFTSLNEISKVDEPTS